MKSIPFFYADLIARMFPGGVFLALSLISTLEIPSSWSDFCNAGKMAGSVVMCPLIFAGLAYIVGTLLEVLLSSRLEKKYIKAFKKTLKTHAWITESAKRIVEPRPTKNLSRATFGLLIVPGTDKEREAASHLIRFHSEAKMTYSLTWIFGIFIPIILLDTCFNFNIIYEQFYWILIFIILIPLLLKVTKHRLESRARFVLRTIELLEQEKEEENISKLLDELKCKAKRIKSS